MSLLSHDQFIKLKNTLVLTLIPIVFTLLFGIVYSNVYVEEIPLAVLDLDQSTTSRTIVDNFEDSSGFHVVSQAETQSQIEAQLLSGDAKAGLILPEGFGVQVLEKKSPKALMLIDGTNIVIGNNAFSYASTIFNLVNAGVQVSMLEGGDMVPYVAEQNLSTLTFTDRMLYDPQLGYFRYVFAGLLGIFIQQTFLSVICPILVEEKLRLKRLPMGIVDRKISVRGLFGEIGVYGLMTFIASLACLLIGHQMFGYPLSGDLIPTLLVQLLFVLDITAVALIITAFFEDAAHCVQFTMFLSIPTLLTSGYVWPEFMMAPHFASIIKAIWPLYYYVNPLRALQIKGAGFEQIAPYLLGAAVFAAFWMPVGLYAYRRKVRTMKQVHEAEMAV